MERELESMYEEHNNSSPFRLEARRLKSIWSAVITQAIMDASSNSKKPYDKRNKLRAISWLFDENKEFNDVCLYAGKDPNYVRQRALSYLKGGAIWKNDTRLLERSLQKA